MRQDLNLRPLRPEGSHLSFKTFFGVFYKIILDYLSKSIRAFLFIFTIFFREIFVNRKSFVINSWLIRESCQCIKMSRNQSISLWKCAKINQFHKKTPVFSTPSIHKNSSYFPIISALCDAPISLKNLSRFYGLSRTSVSIFPIIKS